MLLLDRLKPLFDVPHRHRRVWSVPGRVHLELRELDEEQTARFVDAVQERFTAHPAVEWCEVLGGPGRLVVAHRPEGVSTEELVGLLDEVEGELGLAQMPLGVDRPDHPGDIEPVLRQTLALAADATGLALAFTGRVRRWRALPVEIDTAALLAVADNVPALRNRIERRVTTPVAELALAVGNGIASGLAQGPLGPIVDIAHRAALLSEVEARRRAWLQREPELCAKPSGHRAGALRPVERAVALPPGPVERYAERAWPASLGGFGVGLALTRSMDRAAAALLAGLPKAARLGREAFAAQVGRALAARGVIVFDPLVLRRLDRIDTLVVHARVMAPGRVVLGAVEVVDTVDRGEARQRAATLFDPERPDRVHRRGSWALGPPEDLTVARPALLRRRPGHGGATELALTHHDRLVAYVPLVTEPDDAVSELIAAARRAGLRVLVVGDPEDLPHLSDVDGYVSPHQDLAAVVVTLQRDGHAVAVVDGGDEPALEVADCGIGVTAPDLPPPWGAALLTGAGLDDAWFVLEAIAEARRVSEQSATVAFFGASAGVFLAFGGLVPGTTQRVNTATNAATVLAMGNGARVGLALATRRMPARPDLVGWHALEPDEVLARLESGTTGLSSAVAARRRLLPPTPEPDALLFGRAVADELLNPLTSVLAVGAGLSLAVGSAADAVLVAGVVGANAAIGGYQRFRTDQAIAALSRREQQFLTVWRDGAPVRVAAEDVVPGDVLELEAGDAVPVDARVLAAEALQADESSLTGESLPVDKGPAACASDIVAEHASMLFDGTSIAAGTARAVAVAVGADTEAQRGVALAGEGPPPSGVDARLSSITARVTPLSIGAGLGVLGAGLLRGRPLFETAGAGVSLAVAAVPEGLPLLATVAQNSAAKRLSARGALVRNPRAIEALGRVDVLCVDKTGTLTEGRIRLKVVAPWNREESLDSPGSAGQGVLAAALRATPEVLEGGRLPHPTDRAVIHAGDDTGIRSTTGTEAWERLDELPFEPVRAFHATRGRVGDGVLLSVKGAPEVVLPQCTHRQGVKGRVKLGAAAHRTLEARVDDLARRGLRVLAVAERSLPAGAADGPLQEAAVAGLTFVGLLGLSDPVRPTAAAAVEGVRRAGVEVIMITGDHPTTAEGIAAELDLLDDTVVLTGPEIDELEDDDLADRLAGTTVCARVTPTHKVRIVRALQHRGRTVAMTGDGSNDAPAIRLADVGIALGTRATTAARNAADVVVSDDRVETIVDAIGEGRTLWASVRDAAAVLVGGNLGEIGFTLGAALLQGGPPLNARQLLLVNMLTDALPAMAIAVRPPADHTVESLLREGPDRSLGEALNRAIAVRAIATASGAFAAWGAAKVTGRPARASSVALVALVGAQLGQTIATGGRSPFVLGAGIGSAAVLAAIVQTPGVSQLFGCTPLGPVGWGIGLSAAAAATAGSVVLPSVLDDRVLAWLDRVGLAELPASPVPGAGTDPAPAWLVRPT